MQQEAAGMPAPNLEISGSLDQHNEMQNPSAGSYDTLHTTNDSVFLPVSDIAIDMNRDGMPEIPDMTLELDDSFSWEMIGLGLEEPMPMQEAIDELYVRIPVS